MHYRVAGHVQWRGRKRVYTVSGGLLLCNRRLVPIGLRVMPPWDVLDGAWRDELAHVHRVPAGIILPFCRHWRRNYVPGGNVPGQCVVKVVHAVRPRLILEH